MSYIQKVIITSNRKISRIIWKQHGDELYLRNETEFYRKFNNYQHEDVELFFDSSPDSYSCNFQVGPEYSAVLGISIKFDDPDNCHYGDKYSVYVNGEYAC